MTSKSEDETEILASVDFFERLQNDKLAEPLPPGILGMVKKSEGNDRTIAFAPGVHCANWVTIPLELIGTVEMIRTIACGDHSHPVVKLNMKAPQTAEGKVFSALLEGMAPAHEAMQRGSQANANGFHGSNDGSVERRLSTGFWGCTDTYCGCDNWLDCFLMGASGKCAGRKVICGRNGCVCIPTAR